MAGLEQKMKFVRELRGREPDLNALIEQYATELDLTFDKVYFREADDVEFMNIASSGLPYRFMHWDFGKRHKEMKFQRMGGMHIMELVLNSDPVYAILRKTNTRRQDLNVRAHVYGHADFFKNNRHFAKTNKHMQNHTEMHARIISELECELGEREVEDTMTAILTLADEADLYRPDKKNNPFYYVEANAPLMKHERVLMNIVEDESKYMDVIGKTATMNEGWSMFVEKKIMKQVLPLSEWSEFSEELAHRPAYYRLGCEMFERIERKHGFKKCLEIRKYYDDQAFFSQYITPDLIVKYFVSQEQLAQLPPRELMKTITGIRDRLVDSYTNKGMPRFKISREKMPDERYKVVFKYEDKDNPLDESRIEPFLKAASYLWKGPAELETPDKTYSSDVKREPPDPNTDWVWPAPSP